MKAPMTNAPVGQPVAGDAADVGTSICYKTRRAAAGVLHGVGVRGCVHQGMRMVMDKWPIYEMGYHQGSLSMIMHQRPQV